MFIKKNILIYLHIYIQDPGALPIYKIINPGYKWKYPGVCARARERARARICECVYSHQDMNTITDEYNNR